MQAGRLVFQLKQLRVEVAGDRVILIASGPKEAEGGIIISVNSNARQLKVDESKPRKKPKQNQLS